MAASNSEREGKDLHVEFERANEKGPSLEATRVILKGSDLLGERCGK